MNSHLTPSRLAVAPKGHSSWSWSTKAPPRANRHAFILLCAIFVASTTFAQSTQPAATPVPFSPCETGPGPVEQIDTTYQWSLPLPSPEFERRAYLWIPPTCQHVNGVIVGLQNMLEKLMFQNGDFRAAATSANLAILYIAPGSVSIHNNDPPLSLGFKNPKEATKQLDEILATFAQNSGYTELATAPLITVGHSAATPFVWGYTSTNPNRVIASIPYKGWFPGHTAQGIPILHVSSEWAEVGGPKWGTTWEKNDRGSVIKLRRDGDNTQLGEYAEIGNGHYAWQPASAKILGMFITKAVAARVAPNTTNLKPIPLGSGVLVDPTSLGYPNFKAYPYNDYPGDKKIAFWYLDAELAQTINDYMTARLSKKPQVLDFLINNKPAPLEKTGVAETAPKLLDDGITWKVQACFLDQAPPQLQYGGAALGHSTAPTYFRTGSGALKQVGPDTFRVWLERGGVERQGNPWDPWVIATNPGDDAYRSADRPIHFWIDIRRKDGKPQSVTFPEIPPQHSATKSISLNATASSGLPIQYFIIAGPAEIQDDNTLRFLPIPPRAKFPIKIEIGAYQWGRGSGEKFQSAGPTTREVEITQ